MRTLFSFLLFTTLAMAQGLNVKPPDGRPHYENILTSAMRGDIRVPASRKSGITWKRVYVRLPNGVNRKRAIVWIDNFTHPGPTPARTGEADWLKYDPRNVHLTAHYLVFDAPAGDHIFYAIGNR